LPQRLDPFDHDDFLDGGFGDGGYHTPLRAHSDDVFQRTSYRYGEQGEDTLQAGDGELQEELREDEEKLQQELEQELDESEQDSEGGAEQELEELQEEEELEEEEGNPDPGDLPSRLGLMS
jgi:hypothetical protein